MRGILKEKEWSTLFRPSAAITTEYMPTTYIFTDNGILIKYIIELQKSRMGEKSMFCTKCGAQTSDNEKFCTNCGAPLQASSSDFGSAVPKTPPQQPAQNAWAGQQGNPGQAAYANPYMNAKPVAQLKTNRGLLKFILLSIVTLGIYLIVYFSSISSDINVIASRYDGKKTMHFCLLFFLVSPITCGIATFVWYHKISSRIGSELHRRGIQYHFGAADYWLWNVLGTIIFVGPFIYIYKLSKAMNLLANHFNQFG